MDAKFRLILIEVSIGRTGGAAAWEQERNSAEVERRRRTLRMADKARTAAGARAGAMMAGAVKWRSASRLRGSSDRVAAHTLGTSFRPLAAGLQPLDGAAA